MITHRMLGLLHTRLVANAPRQAGSDEYRMGVDDTIAAVRRLIDAGVPGGPTTSGTTASNDDTARPHQTRLAAEYLQLEMTSLLRTIDSIVQPSNAPRRPATSDVSSLLDARTHLVQARGALMQAHRSASG